MFRRVKGIALLVLALNFFLPPAHAGNGSFEEEMRKMRAAAQDSMDNGRYYSAEDRTHFAAMTFDYGCLYMYFQPEKTPVWADTFFDKVDDDRKKAWRAIAGTDTGGVWYAPFPQGSIALVHDPEKGGCHVISWGSDAALLHKEMRLMSDRAKDKLTHTKVNYFYGKEADSKGRNHSLITILIPDEDTHVLVDAAAYVDNHEPAVISITSNRNFAYTPVPENYTPKKE
jgi:hypothetical protein